MGVDQNRSTAADIDGEWDRVWGLFDALAEPARYRILAHVDACDDVMSVETLAGQITDEGDDPSGSRAALAHVHLPKLSEYGLVEYDRDTLAVRAVPATGRALRLVGIASKRFD